MHTGNPNKVGPTWAKSPSRSEWWSEKLGFNPSFCPLGNAYHDDKYIRKALTTNLRPTIIIEKSQPRRISRFSLWFWSNYCNFQALQLHLILSLRAILMAFTSLNIGRRVNEATSSKVGVNSPQAMTKVSQCSIKTPVIQVVMLLCQWAQPRTSHCLLHPWECQHLLAAKIKGLTWLSLPLKPDSSSGKLFLLHPHLRIERGVIRTPSPSGWSSNRFTSSMSSTSGWALIGSISTASHKPSLTMGLCRSLCGWNSCEARRARISKVTSSLLRGSL